MKTPDEIKKGLEQCATTQTCQNCLYRDECMDVWSNKPMTKDALAYIRQLESEKWDLFFEITAAYYGKMMYGLNDDGTVYSRYSCEDMTFERAVDEFKELISVENT